MASVVVHCTNYLVSLLGYQTDSQDGNRHTCEMLPGGAFIENRDCEEHGQHWADWVCLPELE